MPITNFLDGYKPDPETKRIMGVAFEMVLAALRLADRDDLANEVVAGRIIVLAKTGERDPNLMCEAVLKEFREQRL
jgi:predicted GNAT family N-acyltransferase